MEKKERKKGGKEGRKEVKEKVRDFMGEIERNRFMEEGEGEVVWRSLFE